MASARSLVRGCQSGRARADVARDQQQRADRNRDRLKPLERALRVAARSRRDRRPGRAPPGRPPPPARTTGSIAAATRLPARPREHHHEVDETGREEPHEQAAEVVDPRRARRSSTRAPSSRFALTEAEDRPDRADALQRREPQEHPRGVQVGPAPRQQERHQRRRDHRHDREREQPHALPRAELNRRQRDLDLAVAAQQLDARRSGTCCRRCASRSARVPAPRSARRSGTPARRRAEARPGPGGPMTRSTRGKSDPLTQPS